MLDNSGIKQNGKTFEGNHMQASFQESKSKMQR